MKSCTLIFIIFSTVVVLTFFGLIIALILPWNDESPKNSIKSNYFDSSKDDGMKNKKYHESDVRRKPININILNPTTISPIDAAIIQQIVETGILENSGKVNDVTTKQTLTTLNVTETPSTTTEMATTTTTTTELTTLKITEIPKTSTPEIINDNMFMTTTTSRFQTRRRNRLREKAVTIMLSNSLLKKFMKTENDFEDALNTLPPIKETTTIQSITFPQNPIIIDESNIPIDFSELSKIGVSKIENEESPFEALQRKQQTSGNNINRISIKPVTLPTFEMSQRTIKVNEISPLQTLPPSIIITTTFKPTTKNSIITDIKKESILTTSTILTTQLPLISTSTNETTISNNNNKYIPLNLISLIESPSSIKPSGMVIVDDILFLGKISGFIELYNKTSLTYLGNIKTNITTNQINILSDDTLVISEANNNTLNLVNFEGDVINRLSLPYKNKGISVNQDMIFVLPSSDDEIFIYNTDLTLYKSIEFTNIQEEICNFLAPTSQYIYVACESHIKKINYDGELIKEIGKNGGRYINEIKYDYRTNTLYAIENNKPIIHAFNEDTGEHYKLSFGEKNDLTLFNDIILEEDKLYGSDFTNNQIKIFNFDVNLLNEN
uniref:RING-type domain-containing protein n=1 Tax=Parastrongyloides trichosuri TaxID=131310 RepID=A0A0N4ZND9_PARTI